MKRLVLGVAFIACLHVSAQDRPKTTGNSFRDIAQLEQPGAQRRSSTGMFERYTESARRVVFFARYEVSQLGGTAIESEHLLLGLLRDGAVFSRFLPDARSNDLREEIIGRMTAKEKVATEVDLPLSNESRRILAYAAEEAERLNSPEIGPEHLLLGMLREEKSVAAEVLSGRGLKLNVIREELARAPMPQGSAVKSTAAPPGFSLSDNPVLPKAGVVRDSEFAKRIAEIVWLPLYGAELVAKQQPLQVEQKFNVWIVSGSAAPEDALFVFILRADGRVLSVGRGSGKP